MKQDTEKQQVTEQNQPQLQCQGQECYSDGGQDRRRVEINRQDQEADEWQCTEVSKTIYVHVEINCNLAVHQIRSYVYYLYVGEMNGIPH